MYKTFATGRTTEQPNLKTLDNNKTVANFGLAIDESYTNSEGERVEKTRFVECTGWGKLGEAAAKVLRKGSKVLIEGVASADAYQGKNEIVSKVVITLDGFELLSHPKGSGKQQDADQEEGGEEEAA